MKRHHAPSAALVVATALALCACGKAQDAVGEKAVEKMIESGLSKDGTQAKVSVSEGSMKVSTTDASGKSTQMELGGAKFTEADMGVAFYPGAKPTEGGGMRVATGDSVSLQMAFRSDDAVDKVAAFYRDKLKSMAEGKQLVDMGGGSDGASLSLMDDKAKSTLQVQISKSDKGSDIMILSMREKTK
jgi:hypothetical protein